MTTMTPEQAYAAMYYFLEDYYGRGRPDGIGGMLGGMSLLGDAARQILQSSSIGSELSKER